jgi:hypothetical protein
VVHCWLRVVICSLADLGFEVSKIAMLNLTKNHSGPLQNDMLQVSVPTIVWEEKLRQHPNSYLFIRRLEDLATSS